MPVGPRRRQRTRPAYASSSFLRRTRPAYGWPWKNWYVHPGATYELFYEDMRDSINAFPFPDTNFYHYKWEGRPARVTGLCSYSDVTGTTVVECDHKNTVPITLGYQDGFYGHLNTGLSEVHADYINMALAKNNPGSPTVDLAAFIAELRDLPSLPASLGKLSQAPIATSFGVKPLIADLRAILSLTDSIAARQEQLRKLSQGPQKEHLTLATREYTGESPLTAYAYSGHYGLLKRKTKRRVWAVKTHLIGTNPHKPPPKYDTSYVRRLISSASSVATLWELMPWSWLIDYFVGIQSMINAANGNRIPGYQVTSLCVCIETDSDIEIVSNGRAARWGGGTFHPGHVDILTQTRQIFKNPSPSFPRVNGYLTGGQLSIITQLTLAMLDRRH